MSSSTFDSSSDAALHDLDSSSEVKVAYGHASSILPFRCLDNVEKVGARFFARDRGQPETTN